MAYENWSRVLLHAFLGREGLPSAAADPAEDDVAAVLAAHRSEVDAVREMCRESGRPWPIPPSPDLAAGLPWARYAARVAQLRAELGLDTGVGTVVQPPSRPGRPDREVERLRGDRPPHWG